MPAEAMVFEHEELAISVGVPTPTRLLIDTDRLTPRTRIELTSESPAIETVPSSFEVEATQEGRRVWCKVIRLLASQPGEVAFVAAKSGEISAEILISTRIRLIRLEDALRLEPATMRLYPGQQRQANLYVNLDIVTVGSKVGIHIDTEDGIAISTRALEVGRANAGPSIFMGSVKVEGHRLGAKGVLRAQCGSFECSANIEVVSRREGLLGQGAFVKGFVFSHFENRQQPAYLKEEGILEVNLNEPLNRRYFGSDAEVADAAVAGDQLAQMRLAELLLDECLWKMVTEAYYEKRLAHRTTDAPTDIRQYVLDQKARIGHVIHRLLVNPSGAALESVSEAEIAVTGGSEISGNGLG